VGAGSTGVLGVRLKLFPEINILQLPVLKPADSHGTASRRTCGVGFGKGSSKK
jgi:hypothetical protein